MEALVAAEVGDLLGMADSLPGRGHRVVGSHRREDIQGEEDRQVGQEDDIRRLVEGAGRNLDNPDAGEVLRIVEEGSLVACLGLAGAGRSCAGQSRSEEVWLGMSEADLRVGQLTALMLDVEQQVLILER